MSEPYKRCACGRAYTVDEWARLDPPRSGQYQRYPWGEVQEMRNCKCGSTLAIEVVVGEPECGGQEEVCR